MKIIIMPATAKPQASFLARPCARVRGADPSKSSELSDLLLRLLPTARHSCILQQFCAFSFAQAVPPYSFHLPQTDAPYHVHSKPPSSSLQFKNAHWVRCVRKEDENPSPNFLKYVVHSDL